MNIFAQVQVCKMYFLIMLGIGIFSIGITRRICHFQIHNDTASLTCESAPNPGDIAQAVKHLDRAFSWNLKFIVMDSCNITMLSSETFTALKLKTVEYLDLSQNRINYLAEGLFHSPALISLERLIINHNQISVVPETLFRSPYLKSLNSIDLSFNRISYIPSKLFHNKALENLGTITLKYNNITTVQPNTITKYLKNLYLLNLSHNKISAISTFVMNFLGNCKLSKHILHWCGLDISHNKLSVQETYFIINSKRKRLYGHLDVSYNSIREFQIIPNNWEGYVTVPLNPSWINTTGNQDFTVVNLVKAAMDIDINFINHARLANITGKEIFRLHTLTKAFSYFYNCNCDMLKYLKFQTLDSFKEGMKRYKKYVVYLSDYLKYNPNDLKTSFNLLKCGSPKHLKGRYLETLNDNELQCKNTLCTDNTYCICFETPANDTLRINCVHAKMEKMPLIKYNLTKLEIYIGSSSIQEFPRDNVATLNVTVLDLSHNTIKNIPFAIFLQYPKLRVLNVAGNQLVAIPAYDQWRMMQSLESLQLAGNEFPCTCSGLKLKGILTSLTARNIIKDINNIKCVIPIEMMDKVIYNLAESEFGCPFIDMVLTLTLSLSFLILVLVLLFVAYVFRYYIRLFLFINFGWRFFYNYTKNETMYDIFISYSSMDSDWVVDQLVNPLESLDPPYNLCVHERDFLIGVSISDNMEKAIEESKCTICVISNNWLESDWCQYEFRVAHCMATVKKQSRLLVILKDKIPKNKVKGVLKYYMKTFTYLDSAHPLFWSRLLNDLPRPVVEKQEDGNETRDIIELN